MNSWQSGHSVIGEDAPDVARVVADWLRARIANSSGAFRIALSGGSTPKILFELLATPAYAEAIDWARVQLFWGDERFVPPEHPESNFGMTKRAMLDQIRIPAQNIHPVPFIGTADAAASAYEADLRAAYGHAALTPDSALFDVVFLGLGEDGHTASLIPGEPVLEERERWVAAVAHGRPQARITLTYPAIHSSAAVAFLVTGAAKSAIIARMRAGEAKAPAARITSAGEIVWFLDRAANGV